MPDLRGNWEGASFEHGLQLKFVKSESCVVLGPTTVPGRNEKFSEMIRKTPGLGINPDDVLIAAPIAGVEFVFRHVVNNKRDQYGMLASKTLGRMMVEEVQRMRGRSVR